MNAIKTALAAGAVTAALMTASAASAAGSPPPVNPTTPLASSFNASATIYTNRAAFNAAAGAVKTDDFEFTPTNTTVPNQAFPTGSYTSATTGTTYRLATLPTNPNGVTDLNLLDSTYLPSVGGYIGAHYGSDVLGSNYSDVIFQFAAPTTAFALDFGSFAIAFGTKSDIFAFTVAGLGTHTAFSNAGASAFFGFTSATPFTSIAITTSDNTQRVYDKVSVGAAVAAVPEPAAGLMMILGFGIAGAALRRQVRRSDAAFDAKIKRITDGAIG